MDPEQNVDQLKEIVREIYEIIPNNEKDDKAILLDIENSISIISNENDFTEYKNKITTILSNYEKKSSDTYNIRKLKILLSGFIATKGSLLHSMIPERGYLDGRVDTTTPRKGGSKKRQTKRNKKRVSRRNRKSKNRKQGNILWKNQKTKYH
jgi:hypothetical protein